MSTHSNVRRVFRGAFVLTLFTSVYALNGCGSNTSSTTGGSGTGGFGGGGGNFDAGVGGQNTGGDIFGSGGDSAGGDTFGSGGSASGGTTSDASIGAGGTLADAGLGGMSNVDGGVPDASLGDASPVGTGGSSGAGGSDAAVAACVPSTTVYSTAGIPVCDPVQFPHCSNGLCVPQTLVPPSSLSELADCGGTNKCVPQYFVERLGRFIPPGCTSVNGNEGRCLSTCIPMVASQIDSLPKDVCGDGDLCAPCYDPRTGKNTGACTQGCDPGPKQPAKPFTKCCTGQGSCVPTSLVPAADLSLLGKDTCTGAGQLCAPDKLSDTTYKPTSCKSLSGAEGRCLADCIPSVAAQASRLPKANCDTGELCAPCYDPITGKDTGACTQNGDAPVNPPFQYDACCNSLGHCLPTTLLSAAQKSSLGSDTCTSSSTLCAPDVFSVAGEAPTPCRALGTFDDEGRCVPTCVPSIKAQASELDQGTPAVCPANTLCAPCYDPTTGADTGALHGERGRAEGAEKDVPHVLQRRRPLCAVEGRPDRRGLRARQRHVHGLRLVVRAERVPRPHREAQDVYGARQRRSPLLAELLAADSGPGRESPPRDVRGKRALRSLLQPARRHGHGFVRDQRRQTREAEGDLRRLLRFRGRKPDEPWHVRTAGAPHVE